MANCFNAHFDDTDAEAAEKKVHQLICNHSLTKNWIVIHKAVVPNSTKGREIDTLVLIPRKGLVNIEVKSWRGDLSGEDEPASQARTACFALENYLETNFPDISRTLNSQSVSWLVYTPYGDFESQRYHFLGGTQTPEAIINAIEHILGKGSALFSQQKAEKLAGKLFPKFVAQTAHKAARRSSADELDQVEKVLIELWQALGSSSKTIIEGPAGTGKTIFALNDLKEDSSAIYLCFNRLLAEKLKRLHKSEASRIFTIHQFLARHMGWDPSGKEPLLEALQKPYTGPSVGKVIIDEFQDVIGDWGNQSLGEGAALALTEFLEKIQVGQLNPAWRIFLDQENQKLYGNETPINFTASVRLLHPDLNCYSLSRNYRNPAIWEQHFSEGVYNTFARKEPGQWVSYSSLDECLQSLEKAEVISEEVVFLGHTSVSVNQINEVKNTYRQFKGSTATTTRKYKGLESPVVVLAERPTADALFYTAATRATTMFVHLK